MASVVEKLRRQAEPVHKKVKTLLNSDLKAICKDEGLLVSGVKATLQSRIIERLTDAVESGDEQRFWEIAQTILGHGPQQPQQAQYPFSTPSRQGHSHDAFRSLSNGYGSPGGVSLRPEWVQQMFKKSPFYKIEEALTHPTSLPVMNSARHSVPVSFKLSPSQVDQLQSSQRMAVMIYCYYEFEQNPKDIAFPNQIEIKVNGDLFEGSLRGIKKKPGTTKPADVTKFVSKNSQLVNNVSIAYAATDKRYSFVICMVKTSTVETLVEKVNQGNFIPRQKVISEMMSKANDDDIQATSTILSLKCPLSALRMTLPCRSTICKHNQCFDAKSFLLLQQQAPQWSCPICNRTFNFEMLVVDHYVLDILRTSSTATEQVTVEPNGTWKPGTSKGDEFRVPSSSAKKSTADTYDLDGVVEVGESRVNGIRGESVSTPQSYSRTPTFSSREPSTTASTGPRSGSKRPASEVIDLTGSDDEDDQPPRRPVKKQSFGSAAPTPTSAHSNFSLQSVPLPRSTNQPISIAMPKLPQQQQQRQQQQPQQPPPPPPQQQQQQQPEEHDPFPLVDYFNPGFSDGYSGYGTWM